MTAPGETGAPAPTMTSPIAYFNGQFLPADRISVSPLDRGFIFGDGVYEVIPVYEGVPLRAREHFERLQRSMDEIRLDNPHTVDGWIAIVAKLLEHHPGNQSVYIHVTRGVPPKRDHVIPRGLAPTVMMMAFPLVSPSNEQVERGVACVTARDFRWEKCHIKSISLLGNVLARQISADAGAAETIMFRDGFLTEAAASNVFIVKDGVVAAPPQDNLILLGITYDLLVRLAAEGAITLEIRPVAEAEVRAADEVWLSSSTKEVLAVTTLDGQPVGDGRPGPVFRRMHALFQEHKAMVRQRGAVAA
jgi:D-alanine transaminase